MGITSVMTSEPPNSSPLITSRGSLNIQKYKQMLPAFHMKKTHDEKIYGFLWIIQLAMWGEGGVSRLHSWESLTKHLLTPPP